MIYPVLTRPLSERVSTGKACELLGGLRLDFLRRANEHDVPVYLTTDEEGEGHDRLMGRAVADASSQHH